MATRNELLLQFFDKVELEGYPGTWKEFLKDRKKKPVRRERAFRFLRNNLQKVLGGFHFTDEEIMAIVEEVETYQKQCKKEKST